MAKRILLSLFIAIQFIVGIIADFFGAVADAFTKQEGFNADFGKERLIGSRYNKGFVFSRYKKLSRKLSHSNFLITGVTSSGKSTRLIVKSLFTLRNSSLLIHDPSMELHHISSGYLSKHFVVKTINFSNSSISSGYNLLSRIKTPNDISKLAHLLVATSLDKGGGDPFWSLASKNLLKIIIQIVLYQPEQYRNIANVIQVLHYFAAAPDKVDTWVAKSGDEKLILS